MRCPRCRSIGSVFINETGYRAIECLHCRLAWVSRDDGRWERVVGQDEKLDVIMDGSLVIWDDRESNTRRTC